MKTGEVIKRKRKELGLKVYELAKKVDIIPAYITQIERYNKLPSYAVIKKIEACLDVNITAQYFREKSPDVAEYIEELEKRKLKVEKEVVKLQKKCAEELETVEKLNKLIANIERKTGRSISD